MACRTLDLDAVDVAGPLQQPQVAAPLVHYVIVRADLPHGVQVAQTAHAAGESFGVPQGTIVVALAVPDEQSLHKIADALRVQSQDIAVIVENEGPYAGQSMAIGVAPTTDRAAVRKAVSALPLVR